MHSTPGAGDLTRHRRTLDLLLALVLLASLAACDRPPEPDTERVEQDSTHAWLADAEVSALRAALDAGELSVETLVSETLDRIARLDDDGPRLGSVLALDPRAMTVARELDAELRAGKTRGPLHGIPVLIKGNTDVAGLDNTAGSRALEGNAPERDAFLVARLRDAGAVILGTANLSEWANFRSSRSSSGWSSIGRQTKSPYVTDRNPCGSSSGSAVAVAAGLTVLAIGTETDGSVVCPAGHNGVVGIKPTIGLVSRGGIIPIAHSQDTAGPMARTVRGAALMLQAIAVQDPEDPAAAKVMAAELPDELPDYTAGLAADARLPGVRLGVWRDHFGAGDDPDVEACLTAAITAFEALGAEVVDPADLGDRDGLGDAEGTVLYTEFKPDLAAYLDAHGAPNGFSTLEQLIAYNQDHADTVMPYFGQERFERALGEGELDSPEYTEALAASKRISRGAIDGALAKDRLAAIIAPTNGPAWPIDLVNGDNFVLSSSQLAAVSGYPNVTVPMCFVHQLPVGLSIFGTAFSEAELIRIAHAFEQATHARQAPKFLPTLELP